MGNAELKLVIFVQGGFIILRRKDIQKFWKRLYQHKETQRKYLVVAYVQISPSIK